MLRSDQTRSAIFDAKMRVRSSSVAFKSIFFNVKMGVRSSSLAFKSAVFHAKIRVSRSDRLFSTQKSAIYETERCFKSSGPRFRSFVLAHLSLSQLLHSVRCDRGSSRLQSRLSGEVVGFARAVPPGLIGKRVTYKRLPALANSAASLRPQVRKYERRKTH